MNTMLATGDAALGRGFVDWRGMCAGKPDYDVARLMQRANPALTQAECAAYMAPFPDTGHRAATRAFPAMVPETPDADGAALSRQARDFWRDRWTGKTLMVIGQQDPVLGLPVMQALRASIRGCPEPLLLEQAGHFVPEWGGAVAQQAVRVFGNG